MQEEMDDILKRIEDLRKRLQELSKIKGVTNQEVITTSQILEPY
ncbi:MAG: aspartyl-phosphate phosphatase Spo0E family protein [Bacillota bacterium]